MFNAIKNEEDKRMSKEMTQTIKTLLTIADVVATIGSQSKEEHTRKALSELVSVIITAVKEAKL